MRKLIRVLILTNVLVIVCLGTLLVAVIIAARYDNEVSQIQKPRSTANPNCPELEGPIGVDAKLEGSNKLTLLYTIPYMEDPANCFAPHPDIDGWFTAGWTRVTIVDDSSNADISWRVPTAPAIREWDGEAFLVGDIMLLDKELGSEFFQAWEGFDLDPDILDIEMHFEDLFNHAITLTFHGGCLNNKQILPNQDISSTS